MSCLEHLLGSTQIKRESGGVNGQQSDQPTGQKLQKKWLMKKRFLFLEGTGSATRLPNGRIIHRQDRGEYCPMPISRARLIRARRIVGRWWKLKLFHRIGK